jgi:hypothetical protein
VLDKIPPNPVFPPEEEVRRCYTWSTLVHFAGFLGLATVQPVTDEFLCHEYRVKALPSLALILFSHLLPKAERAHVGPHGFDMSQAFSLISRHTNVRPPHCVLPVGGPNRILLLLVYDDLVTLILGSIIRTHGLSPHSAPNAPQSQTPAVCSLLNGHFQVMLARLSSDFVSI